ncbi:MAG TPA: DUF4342 domain-containing protein [Anaerolineae bacterium]|nr:DUF4342 domain-containing protein [Anaerolineae bacterium]
MSEEKEEQVEEVNIEEDDVAQEEQAQTDWTEEFTVAADELIGVVKSLVHEATVRRIEITNEKYDINLHIPLAVGVAGIFVMGWYAALALIAALVTECTIRVVRIEAPDGKEPEESAEPAAA